MKSVFRQYYVSKPIQEIISEHYKILRSRQTVDYVKYAQKRYMKCNKKIHIWDVFNTLNSFVDVSDPDIRLPNSHHLFQTAEAIRRDGHADWFQLTGLIHDLGKLLYLYNNENDGISINKQWGIVGDTFIVGCHIPSTCVHSSFNHLNPDMKHPIYSTKYGMYEPNCGLDKCMMSFGHDEYLYQVLKHNNCKLPIQAMYMIRYHSLYPWHTEGEYTHLTNEQDNNMLPWVQLFNQYDLYTKCNVTCDTKKLFSYYTTLIYKYLHSTMFW